jgi:hypothetical protein
MTQQDFQLKWKPAELSRIGNRVLQDYRAALADHNQHINKWREYLRRWIGSVDTPVVGEENASNVPVPYIRWNILTKWAKEMDGLFGDDAEIVAVPVGASNYKTDAKVSKYMSWRVFNSMKLLNKFCVFVVRKLIFGRSIAYSPWETQTFEVQAPQGHAFYTCDNCGRDVSGTDKAPPAACARCEAPISQDAEPKPEGTVVDYEGPGFYPEWPDDIIVPVEEVDSIHDFSFVIRRYRVRPDDLLRGEQEGRYQGITENWEQILNLAQKGMQRAWEGEEIKLEKDEIEGLQYQRPLSSGEWVMVLEWYGRWRPLKKGPRGGQPDASEWDTKKREMTQREFVVRYILDLNLVIGVQDLQELYPTKKKRRPFVESSMFKDGRYWSAGMAELLIDLEDELRANHNLATEAGQFAILPPFGYRPAAGAVMDRVKLEPGVGIPLDNPQTDLVQIKISANMDVAQWKEQCVLAYGEKLTGQGDLQMGRQSDRPNAPRTGVQTQQLLDEGNVRISLDTKVLREDMSEVLTHFWDLEYMFAGDQTFFRVTEEDADGLFETNNGGAMLTLEDRDGRYDFRLEFANSVYSRETKKQQNLALYQLDLQNPLVVNNPPALWEATNRAHEALGDPNFTSMIPKPPEPDASIDPKDEWIKLLHGEDIHVNPLDNDLLHMTRHMKDLKAAEAQPGGPTGDPEAQRNLVIHYHDHLVQLQQKKLQQAVVEQAVQAAQQLAQSGQPLAFPNGLFGNAPQEPAGNPQATGPFLYSGHPEDLHGNS